MKRFEYKADYDLSFTSINELGKEGWELIVVVQPFNNPSPENNRLSAGRLLFYFKRELSEKQLDVELHEHYKNTKT